MWKFGNLFKYVNINWVYHAAPTLGSEQAKVQKKWQEFFKASTTTVIMILINKKYQKEYNLREEDGSNCRKAFDGWRRLARSSAYKKGRPSPSGQEGSPVWVPMFSTRQNTRMLPDEVDAAEESINEAVERSLFG